MGGFNAELMNNLFKFSLALIIIAMSLSAVRVSRTSGPTAAVIIFHGLGDSGQGWKFLADIANRTTDYNHIKFIFPNAPIAPVTANGGHKMPSWFDIIQFGGDPKNQDVPSYFKALKSIDDYVKEVTDAGIPTERIIIGGFSQGGGMTLGKAVESNNKFAGFIGMSPMIFPFLEPITKVHSHVNDETPIFHGHGQSDPMINVKLADSAAAYFKDQLKFKEYTYKTYPNTGHSLAEEELGEILEFIKDKLPK